VRNTTEKIIKLKVCLQNPVEELKRNEVLKGDRPIKGFYRYQAAVEESGVESLLLDGNFELTETIRLRLPLMRQGS